MVASQIFVLNGTSSSGKTTIARALQELSVRPLLNFSLDTLLYTLPDRELERMKRGEELIGVSFESLVVAYFASIRALARAGLSLVVHSAATARHRAEQLIEAVAGHDVVLVGIDCPVEVLETREAARKDRRLGLARAQSQTIHRWLRYDVVVNTQTAPPHVIAATILNAAASASRSGYAESARALSACG